MTSRFTAQCDGVQPVPQHPGERSPAPLSLCRVRQVGPIPICTCPLCPSIKSWAPKTLE
jgi:hypothetical protein